MELSNCVACGKMFRHDGLAAKRCPECHAEDEDRLRVLREFIQMNPGLTAFEVSEKSGLPYRQIIEWIRQGRIIR